jgi:hypothetical protein
MGAFPDECEAAGLDVKQVDRIAKRLESAARDARKLGLEVFGGSGSASLRVMERGDTERALVVADISGGSWNGGDGSYGPDENGLNRGES